MYIASGACAIEYQSDKPYTKARDTGLAMGSFCIITGTALAMDFAMVVFKYGRKGGPK